MTQPEAMETAEHMGKRPNFPGMTAAKHAPSSKEKTERAPLRLESEPLSGLPKGPSDPLEPQENGTKPEACWGV